MRRLARCLAPRRSLLFPQSLTREKSLSLSRRSR